MVETAQIDALEQRIEQIAAEPLDADEIRSLLRQLGTVLGGEALDVGDDGLVALALDEDLSLILTLQDGLPGFTVSIPLPNEPRGRAFLYRRLLQANLNWADTAAGAFLLIPGDETLVLARRIDLADRHLERVASELGQFVELGRHWHTEIQMFCDLFDEGDGGAQGNAAADPSDSNLIRA